MNAHIRRSVVALVTAALALITACDSTGGSNGGSALDDPATTRTFDELMKKPTIDEAVQRYTEMQDRILRALSAAIPSLRKWKEIEEGTGSGCLDNEAKTTDLGRYVAYQKVPEEEWSNVVDTVRRIAVDYGFNDQPQVLRDKPGAHFEVLHNINDDSSITFGTEKNSILGVDVGCHLTAEAKQRGRPATPTY